MAKELQRMKLFLLIFLISTSAISQESKLYESDYVNMHCKGKIEFVLPDKTRVDCLTDTHAIEYDYGRKWAEAIGKVFGHFSNNLVRVFTERAKEIYGVNT